MIDGTNCPNTGEPCKALMHYEELLQLSIKETIRENKKMKWLLKTCATLICALIASLVVNGFLLGALV